MSRDIRSIMVQLLMASTLACQSQINPSCTRPCTEPFVFMWQAIKLEVSEEGTLLSTVPNMELQLLHK